MEEKFYNWLNTEYYLTEGKNIKNKVDFMGLVMENNLHENKINYKGVFIDVYDVLFDFIKSE